MRQPSRRSAKLALCLLAFSAAARAETLDYYVIRMDLADVLKEASLDTSTTIVMSDKARGVVRDTRLNGALEEVLSQLAQPLGLDWFSYNDVYYVSTREEATTRVIPLGQITPAEAIAGLEQAGLWQPKHAKATMFEDGALILTGPPQLLALVEAVVQFVQVSPDVRATPKAVTIRKAGVILKDQGVAQSGQLSSEPSK